MAFKTIHPAFPLILASASPRRKSLLRQVGIPFRAVPGWIDEEGETGRAALIARSLAEKKAKAASRKTADHWVLGADTIVVLGGDILGKPADHRQASSMLSLLSGNEHKVITGFCILDPSGRLAHSEEVETLVRFVKLRRREIEAYIATGEPFGKAGSYAIQGVGAFMVGSIAGSYSNVVGLPLTEVIGALVKAGALKRFPLAPEVRGQRSEVRK